MPEALGSGGTSPQVLVLACGALAKEILAISRLNAWDNVTLECLPADLHNHPKEIPGAVAARLDRAEGRYDRILIGYGDCGTGGRLDALIEERGLERLPGAHCYEFFTTSERFLAMHEAELGTLYLTDYFARHFDRLIWQNLGIEAHPELRDMYFGNYTRVVYISQAPTPELEALARAAADTIGLRYEHIHVGYGDLGRDLIRFVEPAS